MSRSSTPIHEGRVLRLDVGNYGDQSSVSQAQRAGQHRSHGSWAVQSRRYRVRRFRCPTSSATPAGSTPLPSSLPRSPPSSRGDAQRGPEPTAIERCGPDESVNPGLVTRSDRNRGTIIVRTELAVACEVQSGPRVGSGISRSRPRNSQGVDVRLGALGLQRWGLGFDRRKHGARRLATSTGEVRCRWR